MEPRTEIGEVARVSSMTHNKMREIAQLSWAARPSTVSSHHLLLHIVNPETGTHLPPVLLGAGVTTSGAASASKPPVTSCPQSGGDGPHTAGRCGVSGRGQGQRKAIGRDWSLSLVAQKRMTEASNNGRNDLPVWG